ncbi:MAG: hypothetical protein RR444_12960 [Oscillospiraceae bacterium]|uniref:hypothetical protein n=1 Tax=Hafnia alvei TaxID=569 RepID=UPI00242AE98E|nr:hypothetical protein [Hafnia alvei]
MTMAKVRAKVAARKIQAIAGRKAEDRTVKALSLPTPRAAKELVEVEHKQHRVVSGVNISAFGRQKIRGKSIPLI